jgi:hypothetical protein
MDGLTKNIPYVYIIKNKSTGLKYIGAKYSKNSNPNNFWVNYFTSSKLIHKLIEFYGVNDFEFKIIKTFNSVFDTLQYERKLISLSLLKDDYLNLHSNFVVESEEEYEFNQIKMKKVRSFYGNLSYLMKLGFHGFTDEIRYKVCSDGGKMAAIVNKLNKKGLFNKENITNIHKKLKEKQLSAYYDPSLRFDICSKGGKNGFFSDNYRVKNNLTEDEMRGRQSDRGKKGGVKNKGFKWYNDGVNVYKYMPEQIKELPFDEFLKQNNQFKRGPGKLLKSIKLKK